MRSVPRRRTGPRERGQVAVFVVLTIAFLIGILGLAINTGHLLVARNELQTAAEAGALAGAAELVGTGGGVNASQTVACQYAAMHRTDRTAVSCTAADVTRGTWNPLTRTFQATTTPASAVNAIRVGAARDATHAGQLPVFLSGFFGFTGSDVRARPAIAFRGGPCAATNVMPFVVTDCALRQGGTQAGNLRCDLFPPIFNNVLLLSSTGNGVATSFRTANVTGNGALDMQTAVRQALTAVAAQAGGGTIGPRTAVTQVPVDVVPVNPLGAYAAWLNPLIGRQVLVPIRYGGAACNAGWTGQASIVGFATMTFWGCGLTPIPVLCTPASTSILLQMTCGTTPLNYTTVAAERRGACPNYGTWWSQPVLVDLARP